MNHKKEQVEFIPQLHNQKLCAFKKKIIKVKQNNALGALEV